MWRFQYLNAVSLFLSAYPWRSEHEKGREEGIKDRPCVIILAVENDEGHLMVTVAPVTHSAPLMPDTAVEIPLATKRRLGLDDARSWVMVNEGNRFAWPLATSIIRTNTEAICRLGCGKAGVDCPPYRVRVFYPIRPYDKISMPNTPCDK